MSTNSYSLVPAGITVTNARPGDFLLARSSTVVSKLILRGASRCYTNEQAVFAQYSHAALIVDPEHVVESRPRSGVRKKPLAKYNEVDYILVHTNPVGVEPDSQAAEAMRKNAADFALSCVGSPYGFRTSICVGIGLVTGKFTLGFGGYNTCSGLVARSLERMGYNFGAHTPIEIMPADLAFFFHVGVPRKPKGPPQVITMQTEPGRLLNNAYAQAPRASGLFRINSNSRER